MVALLTTEVPQAPPVQPVRLALFQDLQETQALIEKLKTGTLTFALIDARTIVSTHHVLAAVFRALNDESNGRMKTRNVHSEILLALNFNNNIVEAYRKFGVQQDTKSLLAVKIGSENDDQLKQELEQVIKGELIEVSDENLARFSDLDSIRKLYKLGGKSTTTSTLSIEGKRKELEASVIESIALRGAS